MSAPLLRLKGDLLIILQALRPDAGKHSCARTRPRVPGHVRANESGLVVAVVVWLCLPFCGPATVVLVHGCNAFAENFPLQQATATPTDLLLHGNCSPPTSFR